MDLKEIVVPIQQNKYVYSLMTLIVFYLLSKLVVFISQKVILRLTRKTKTDVDDLIVKRTNKPISLMLLFIGVRLALLPLGIGQGTLDIIENIVSSILIILATYIIITVVDILIDNWGKTVAAKTESTLDDQLIPVFHRFSTIFISILGFLFILTFWGVQIGPLLTSLGIAGVAIAFALQNTLGNIFGGVSIILDKSIKVGDKIKIDNDTMGTVIDIGLRSTKILTWDNEVITIPNGKLADTKILNFAHQNLGIRVVIDIGVGYGSDIPKVRKLVIDTIKKITGVLKEPAPRVMMMEMGDFALKFKALFWVSSYDIKFDTKSIATEEIYAALAKAKISIPFPTRTVYIKK